MAAGGEEAKRIDRDDSEGSALVLVVHFEKLMECGEAIEPNLWSNEAAGAEAPARPCRYMARARVHDETLCHQ